MPPAVRRTSEINGIAGGKQVKWILDRSGIAPHGHAAA